MGGWGGNLGAGFACDKRVARLERREKLSQTRKRPRRVRCTNAGKARKLATPKVARPGLEASVSYGWSVTGCAAGELDKARSVAFAFLAPSVAVRSRALTLVLTEHLDPVHPATLLPVLMLLRAVWEHRSPFHMVVAGLTRSATESWAQVRGPSPAATMALRRVGWRVVGATA